MKHILKLIKNFLLYTLKKVYSFFIYITLTFITLSIIAGVFIASNMNESNTPSKYSNLIISDIDIPQEDKFYNSLDYIEGKKITFSEIYKAINFAINDDNISTVFINLDTTTFSTPQIEEITPLFNKLKEKNKKIVAYGENLDNSSYQIGLLANEIVVPKTENTDIHLGGYSISNMYFKNILDKFGIKFEVIHVGSHKSYGEEYYRENISKEQKETLTRIYDKKLEEYISNISKVRKIDKETVRNKLLNGEYALISPKTARDLSLVDSLEDYSDLSLNLNITDDNSITIQDYISKVSENNNSENNIAVIYLDGDIDSVSSTYGNTNITSENFKVKLDKALEINNLKGIVIRINSGGGSALESKKIYDMIMELKVPVYVSIGNIAASGGYYISSAADKIFIENFGLTGSIGVVSMLPKYVGTLNKLNINVNHITRGKYLNISDPSVELTNEDRIAYMNRLEAVYNEFKNDILVKRTGLNPNSLENIAQGKVWLGLEAKELKLVDEIGGLYDTIDSLQNSLQLDNKYSIVDIYSTQEYNNLTDILKSNIGLLKFKNKINFDFLENKVQFIINQNSKPMFYEFIQNLEN
ncbi:signal peptide peptidase SppA [Pseudostreptobacillus sp.]